MVNALPESAWGTFTIAMTIPIALVVGPLDVQIRPGKIAEASVIGVVAVFAAVIFGDTVAAFVAGPRSSRSPGSGIIVALAVYGFFASVLPVWLLLVPAGLPELLHQDRHDRGPARRASSSSTPT